MGSGQTQSPPLPELEKGSAQGHFLSQLRASRPEQLPKRSVPATPTPSGPGLAASGFLLVTSTASPSAGP